MIYAYTVCTMKSPLLLFCSLNTHCSRPFTELAVSVPVLRNYWPIKLLMTKSWILWVTTLHPLLSRVMHNLQFSRYVYKSPQNVHDMIISFDCLNHQHCNDVIHDVCPLCQEWYLQLMWTFVWLLNDCRLFSLMGVDASLSNCPLPDVWWRQSLMKTTMNVWHV